MASNEVRLDRQLTMRGVASALGYSVAELRRAHKRVLGFPKEVGGKLNLGEAARALYSTNNRLPAEIQVAVEAELAAAEKAAEEPIIDEEEAEKAGVVAAQQRAKLRKLEQDANLAEVRARTAAGEVVLVDEVIEAVAPLLISISTELNSLPAKLAARFARESDTHKIRVMLDRAISEALHRLKRIDIKQVADEAARKTATVRSRDKDRRAIEKGGS